MATVEEIAILRRLINDTVEPYEYEDAVLEAYIDAATTVNAAAGTIWREKAAKYSTMVDVQEGSSRRSLGDLYEQALSLSKYFDGIDLPPGSGMRPGRTRAIERP